MIKKMKKGITCTEKCFKNYKTIQRDVTGTNIVLAVGELQSKS